jgi:hypothetical protein
MPWASSRNSTFAFCACSSASQTSRSALASFARSARRELECDDRLHEPLLGPVVEISDDLAADRVGVGDEPPS